ncbi:hypothetical protein [Vreelandella aquamarina]|uniref:hypothetical protein n=1 Tax=Vreelandella aquamarina TaxID=77097 RepID=UPI00115FB007|nr:hypothetical protein [Halomonas aquamarina]
MDRAQIIKKFKKQKKEIVVLKKKIIVFLDRNIIFFSFVSFLLSILVYLVIGSKIDISNLLTVSLAVSGGLWSLMSVEQGKVKELRGEYIENLKQLESVCLECIYLSSDIFGSLVKFDVVDDELKKEKYIEIIDMLNELHKKHSCYTYNLINIRNNDKNKKEFKNLDKLMKAKLQKLHEYVDLLTANKLWLEGSDESDMNDLMIEIMQEMNKVFSKEEVGFENFSEHYLFIKIVCFSIIMTFVFSVFWKAILL